MKFLQMYTIKVDTHRLISEFHDAYEYGEENVLSESIGLEEMASVRRQRQKSVLLEKVGCISNALHCHQTCL